MEDLEKAQKNIKLPVYIINLTDRLDRLKHIRSQFKGRNEFELRIMKAIKHPVGAVGLWKSIRCVIEDALEKNEDLIILCEDDHSFTKQYSKKYLIDNIIKAAEKGTNLLLGGIGGFQQVIPLTSHLYWVDNFYCTQFTVIFKNVYRKILDEPFDETDTADGKLSEITSLKMVIHPFISIQKEFGYSDVTQANNKAGIITDRFEKAAARIKMISHVNEIHSEISTTSTNKT